MNARLYFTTDGVTPVEPIEELSAVSLRENIETEAGIIVAGTKGTVVSVYASGVAYCVEFEEPFHALATVGCKMLDAIEGESRADLALPVGIADR